MFEFLRTTLGQIAVVAFSLSFLFAVTMTILKRHDDPHISRVFGFVSLALGLIMLAASLSVVFSTLPDTKEAVLVVSSLFA